MAKGTVQSTQNSSTQKAAALCTSYDGPGSEATSNDAVAFTSLLNSLPEGTIVAIEWFDAYGLEGAETMAEALDSTAREVLCDVGFFMGVRSQYVIFAMERGVSSMEHYRTIHRIPVVNVTRVDVLRTPHG